LWFVELPRPDHRSARSCRAPWSSLPWPFLTGPPNFPAPLLRRSGLPLRWYSFLPRCLPFPSRGSPFPRIFSFPGSWFLSFPPFVLFMVPHPAAALSGDYPWPPAFEESGFPPFPTIVERILFFLFLFLEICSPDPFGFPGPLFVGTQPPPGNFSLIFWNSVFPLFVSFRQKWCFVPCYPSPPSPMPSPGPSHLWNRRSFPAAALSSYSFQRVTSSLPVFWRVLFSFFANRIG